MELVETATPSTSASLAMQASTSSSLLSSAIPFHLTAVLLLLLAWLTSVLLNELVQTHAKPFGYFACFRVGHLNNAAEVALVLQSQFQGSYACIFTWSALVI